VVLPKPVNKSLILVVISWNNKLLAIQFIEYLLGFLDITKRPVTKRDYDRARGYQIIPPLDHFLIVMVNILEASEFRKEPMAEVIVAGDEYVCHRPHK
jgi:hypothetical protein